MSHAPSTDDQQTTQAKPMKRGLPRTALAMIAMGLGGLGLTAATSDAQFARGLEQAIAATPAVRTATVRRSGPSVSRSAPVAGTEAFWLGAAANTSSYQPVTYSPRAIVPGDRFQFGGGRGQRILEVTDVREMPLQTASGTSNGKSPAPPMLMLTMRDVASPRAAPVRMLLEADAPIAGLTPLQSVHPADL